MAQCHLQASEMLTTLEEISQDLNGSIFVGSSIISFGVLQICLYQKEAYRTPVSTLNLRSLSFAANYIDNYVFLPSYLSSRRLVADTSDCAHNNRANGCYSGGLPIVLKSFTSTALSMTPLAGHAITLDQYQAATFPIRLRVRAS
jgi:hypothetical protein